MANVIEGLKSLWAGIVSLANIDARFDNLTQRLDTIEAEMKDEHEKTRVATAELSKRLDTFNIDMVKVKEGLQIELFGTLRDLHDKLQNKNYATHEEKVEAKQIYDQIHNLGQDGWSQKYYDEIIAMPESREEYWASLNKNH